MPWLFSSSNSSNAPSSPVVKTEQAPSEASASKSKPCCVCKAEKAARDDCMLFSKTDDPSQSECRPIIEQYKNCMAGFGFKV